MYLFISIVLSVVCVGCLWIGSLYICLFLLHHQLFVLVVCGQVRYVFVYFYCIVSCLCWLFVDRFAMYLFISIVLSVVCVGCLWIGSLCICLFLLHCQLFVLVVCG